MNKEQELLINNALSLSLGELTEYVAKLYSVIQDHEQMLQLIYDTANEENKVLLEERLNAVIDVNSKFMSVIEKVLISNATMHRAYDELKKEQQKEAEEVFKNIPITKVH